jgi:20S proteasome alpha/beta subunit
VDPDKEPKLFVTDPSGSYMKFHIAVIGNRSDSALSFLSDKYTRNVSLNDAKILVAAAIRRSTISSPEEVKIRFLEIPLDTCIAELKGLRESSEYLERAREVYGD